ncbi:Predicted ATPase, AAA+ superfamily [Catalinimonas alkaloidigena]|uniref:Predicted ATPase, AAA+ superfamily n=1 Tax=Catalinimonas alkaloidigena TaxID=1075417 RepID=A0A1G9VII3_9BACT|nr:DUF499 domain-containing protein [Catalinimonas alkaloidigena]SDM71920.1 Predicted ATPase, AAA+ superfamily [Catalinimonas alkaloidigena]
MSTARSNAWHQVAKLRSDLLTGELPQHLFAADLYEVVMQRGEREMYEDPRQFFARTFVTHSIRELAGDVGERLAGRSSKAVRQLALNYGGGKTHTQITLYHLFSHPKALVDIPTAADLLEKFRGHVPKARVAALSFDKLDVKLGMEVRAPNGNTRRLLYAWNVLAYQLAGDQGLEVLHGQAFSEERDTPPSELVLSNLFQIPESEGLAVLILLDEVMMYARNWVGTNLLRQGQLRDFFQSLTQAAAKAKQCAVVASLLGNDPSVRDNIGKSIEVELMQIFNRQEEARIQPVAKEDIADVLRRQFFESESLTEEVRRKNTVTPLDGLAKIDQQTEQHKRREKARFEASYPFHPDLTEVFYTKWAQMENFQQTRGILRVFALALREAAVWEDTSLLIGPNVFLAAPNTGKLSEGLRELAEIASVHAARAGDAPQWSRLLERELGHARQAQELTVDLKNREVEQAVVTTFLHSQPIGQEARLRELILLMGHTYPIKINLYKGLRMWANTSWFLDDEKLGQKDAEGIPEVWRLGFKPNLTQMQADARRNRVSDQQVEAILTEQIESLQSLTKGVKALDIALSKLPRTPGDITDNPAFKFVILPPSAASEANKPSEVAKRFLETYTNLERPRVYKNSMLCVAPSASGLETVREAIRDMRAWEWVEQEVKNQGGDVYRRSQASTRFNEAKRRVPDAVKAAYCIVITFSEKNQIIAFQATPTDEQPLFEIIKADKSARIQETAIEPSALLPDGPYEIWGEGEPFKKVRDMVDAFFQYPRLPKVLQPEAVRNTIKLGCRRGIFVLRYRLPDGSMKTYWRAEIESIKWDEDSLVLMLPEKAELTELTPALLAPGALPDLWQGETITLGDLYTYFAGGKEVIDPPTDEQPYPDLTFVPKAAPDLIQQAVISAVRSGNLMISDEKIMLWKEEVPPGVLKDTTVINHRPDALPYETILPDALPEAWSGKSTNAKSIFDALMQKRGRLPWTQVQQVISSAKKNHQIQSSLTSGEWPCELVDAVKAQFELYLHNRPANGADEAPLQTIGTPTQKFATVTPEAIQDLADNMGELLEATAGYDLQFRLDMSFGEGQEIPTEVKDRVNNILKEFSNDIRVT